jgi:hypothetical protein
MSVEFVGSGLPLDEDGISEVTDRMQIGGPELWAVLNVETRGCGFLPDRRPAILYERHIFSRETGHQFDAAHPDISNRQAGGYGASGAHQYDRLARAIALNRKAALDSVSWGIGQLMGFNAEIAGYPDVEAMVSKMTESESEQLRGMSGEIVHNGLHRALRTHRWADFARGYNGVNFAINKYDTRLAAAFQKYSQGGLPDLAVRAAQVYLTYLNLHPGTVDGLPGRFTFAALNEFQSQQGLPISNVIDDEIVSRLKEKALAEP